MSDEDDSTTTRWRLPHAMSEAYSRGWSVMPLWPQKKTPILKKARDDQGRPVRGVLLEDTDGWEHYQHERATPEDLARWRRKWPSSNYAIITGVLTKLVVFDVDGADGQFSLAQIGVVPRTPKVKTGKGVQYYFLHPGITVGNYQGKRAGLDFRGDGGYVVGPGSIHPNGSVYTWEISPDETPFAHMPDWLLALSLEKKEEPQSPEPPQEASNTARRLPAHPESKTHDADRRAFAKKALHNEAEKVRSEPDGTKHERLRNSAIAVAGFVQEGLISEQEIEQTLYEAIQDRAADKRNALDTIRDGIRYGAARPRSIPDRPASRPMLLIKPPRRVAEPDADASGEGGEKVEVDVAPPEGIADFGNNCTDLGNAERLIRYFSTKMRFVEGVGWLSWQETYWERGDAPVIEMAKATARAIRIEAASQDKEKRALELLKHAHRSEGAQRITAMVALAKSDPRVRCSPSDLDKDPYLLNCQNGTLDLRTGELRGHCSADLITRISPVSYDAGAPRAAFEQFLRDVFNSEEELISFVQRAAGYTATGLSRERSIFFNHGGGRNGKSTLFAVLGEVLGTYAQTADFSTFLVSRHEANKPRDDLMDMQGARLVRAVEASEGQRFDEGLLKQLAGGEDEINARRMHMNRVTFRPTAKLWLAANTKPHVRDTTNSIWDRIKLIPYKVRFGDLATEPGAHKQIDLRLPERLREEYPGILAWVVEGALIYLKEGLNPPAQVQAATKEYRNEQDLVEQFLDARCECLPAIEGLDELEILTAGKYELAKTLYQSFAEWCVEEGVVSKKDRTMSKIAFGKKLQAKGFVSKVVTDNKSAWWGLQLKPVGSEN